jgi:hypothetical protein
MAGRGWPDAELALWQFRPEGIHDLNDPQKTKEQKKKPGQRTKKRKMIEQRNHAKMENYDEHTDDCDDGQMRVVQFYLQDFEPSGFHGVRLKIVRCRRTEQRGYRYQEKQRQWEAASRTALIAALENCGAIATSVANFCCVTFDGPDYGKF